MTNPFDDTVADEYQNPFASGGYAEPPRPAVQVQNTPMQTNYSPPAATSSVSAPSPPPAASAGAKPLFPFGKGTGFTDPLTGAPVNEDDLERREAELARREREIEDREHRLANGTLTPAKSSKNFPPILKWYSYHPDEDLPEASRKQAKYLFYIYLAIGIIYLLNWIGSLACLSTAAAKATSSPATKIVLSSIFLFVFFPLSFEVSYFVYYNAIMEGRGLKFVCFMITYVIWGGALIYNAIGIDDGGSIGWIQMINLFGGEGGAKGVAVIALIFSLCATGMAGLMVFMFIKLIKYFRTEGLEKKTYQEAAKFTAEKANDNRDILIEAARENPELVQQAAGAAVSSYTPYS